MMPKLACSTRGLMAQVLRSFPLAGGLEFIRQAGAGGVELYWSQVERAFADQANPGRRLRDLLADKGLALTGINLPQFVGVDDGEDQPAATKALCDHLAGVAETGCASCNLFAYDRGEQGREVLVRAVAAVAEAARPLGMSVDLANWRGTRIEQIEDLRYLVAAARAGNVGVLLDAAQFHASAVNPLDVLAEFSDLVGCVHLGDCVGHRPVPVGQGEVNLGGVLRQARHAGYDGWFVIDFEVSGREDPLEGLAEALSHVQSLA